MTSVGESEEEESRSTEDTQIFKRFVSSCHSYPLPPQRLSAIEIHKLRNLTQTMLPISDEEQISKIGKYESFKNLSTPPNPLDLAQVPLKASTGEPLQLVALTAATATTSSPPPTPPPTTTTTRMITSSRGKPMFPNKKWRQVVSRYQYQRSISGMNDRPPYSKSLIPLESRVNSGSIRQELPLQRNGIIIRDHCIRQPPSETYDELSSLASAPQASVVCERQKQHQRTRPHPLLQLCRLQTWYTTNTPPRCQFLSTIPSVVECHREPTDSHVSENTDDEDDSAGASIPCVSLEQSDVRRIEKESSSLGVSYFVNEIVYSVVFAMVLYKALFQWAAVYESSPGTNQEVAVLQGRRSHTPVKHSQALVAWEPPGSLSSGDTILAPNHLGKSLTTEIPFVEWIGHQEAGLVDTMRFDDPVPPPPFILPERVECDILRESKVPIDTIISDRRNPSFEWHVANLRFAAPKKIRKLEQILNDGCFACDEKGEIQPLALLSNILMLNRVELSSNEVWDSL